MVVPGGALWLLEEMQVNILVRIRILPKLDE